MEKETYQALNARLDEVLAKLQSPDVDIDEATVLFEQALELTKQMEKHLHEAENRITQLKAKFGREK